VAGFFWARAWAVNIEEMDVSNGPESGRNLAVIVPPPNGKFVPRNGHGERWNMSKMRRGAGVGEIAYERSFVRLLLRRLL